MSLTQNILDFFFHLWVTDIAGQILTILLLILYIFICKSVVIVTLAKEHSP